VLVYGRGGRYGHIRSVTLTTARPLSQARCSWSPLSLGFAADERDMICAGAVDVVGEVVDEEESPWPYCDEA